MDALTHALLGAAAAYGTKTPRARLSARDRLAVGAIAGGFPDIDFLLFVVDPLRFLADWHQAATHSLVLLPLWAIAIGAVWLALLRRQPLLFAEATIVAAIALLTHIASDVLTAYGTALFYPLSDRRLRLDTTFVIDPVFTGIVLVALICALRSERRMPLAFGLAVLCGYVGGQALLRERALDVARDTLAEKGLSPGGLTALPQPLSPFNWKLLDVHEEFYRVSHVNLVGHPPLVPALPGFRGLQELAGAYRAPDAIEWTTRQRYGADPKLRTLVEERWLDPRFGAFRRFATHPSISRIDRDGSAMCIWFTDLRYDLPTMIDTFRYGFCRPDERSPWRLYSDSLFLGAGVAAVI